ncbi:uncharacterized protein DUF3558 [Actinophytocola oryzae]|uniref:Uncharacterized protein DUF3558 n=2 Tax=Actinophytocola oryzae TaxID=502181 RepID=A0A4R7VB19_9PSEU|nr:uncharacterized protein DUF3558 [Actinophytocola oryzae]
MPSVAPSVSRPVDLGPYYDQPCSLLNAQQLTELGFPADDQIEDEQDGARVCAWSRDNSNTDASFTLLSISIYTTGDPLAAAYQKFNSDRAEDKWQTIAFGEHTVRGLPAVTRGDRDDGSQCEATVGAGNGQGIVILGHLYTYNEKPELCDRLVTAAELVVDAVRR